MCHEVNPGYQRAQQCTTPRQITHAGYNRDGFCRAHRAWCQSTPRHEEGGERLSTDSVHVQPHQHEGTRACHCGI